MPEASEGVLRAVVGAFLDLIYPPRCLICGASLDKPHPDESPSDTDPHPLSNPGQGVDLCVDCLRGFLPLSSPLCPICGTPYPSSEEEDHPCEACLQDPPPFEALHAPFRYEGTLLQAVHRLKYGRQRALASPLGAIMARFARARLGQSPPQVVTPVPLHPKRLRERGFNQSLVLARAVASALNATVEFLSLRRTRHTAPQTRLSMRERGANVKGAFMVWDARAFKDRGVLLVDDVATTGSTLKECAAALRSAGASRVEAMVLARAGTF